MFEEKIEAAYERRKEQIMALDESRLSEEQRRELMAAAEEERQRKLADLEAQTYRERFNQAIEFARKRNELREDEHQKELERIRLEKLQRQELAMAALDAAQGEILEAEQKLRRAHQLEPGEPGVLADLGGLYLDAGHPDEALSLFADAVALAPGRAEFRFAHAEGNSDQDRGKGKLQGVGQGIGYLLTYGMAGDE